MSNPIYPLADALRRSPSPNNLAAAIATHGAVDIEFYQPKGEDRQTPHERDELYVVARGSGMFELDGNSYPFETGDAVFVPAHAVHRFASFSEDFAVWVLFLGT